jgi:hypothetical protein
MSDRVPVANPTKACEVADIVNYSSYRNCCGFLISEPKRYVLTHVLIWGVMVLYYVVTASRTPVGLLVVTVVLNACIEGVLLALGLMDPGIIPKILQRYEQEELRMIPLDYEYESGGMRDVQRMYVFPLKSHSLRVKFCSSCYTFRPPRATHCG